jgi:hypothetical protein
VAGVGRGFVAQTSRDQAVVSIVSQVLVALASVAAAAFVIRVTARIEARGRALGLTRDPPTDDSLTGERQAV